MIATTWADVASGVGTLLTGVAATFGVIAAFFRFRRSHEARVNVSMELRPCWVHLDTGRAVVVRVDVHNDGGRRVVLLADHPADRRISSRIGVSVLAAPPAAPADGSVTFVRWGGQPGRGARLLDDDAELAAGDTWHADFAFTVPDDATLARAAVELQLQERPSRWRRDPPQQLVRTDVITGRDERSDDGTSTPPHEG